MITIDQLLIKRENVKIIEGSFHFDDSSLKIDLKRICFPWRIETVFLTNINPMTNQLIITSVLSRRTMTYRHNR